MAKDQQDIDDPTFLAARAEELRASGISQDDKWMLDLHRDLTVRFISDNTRIWTTGSIFVGIAFASLAISPEAVRGGAAESAVAGASVALVVIWNLIADRQREFQQRSMRWMDAIERLYLSGAKPVTTRTPLVRIQVLRWILPLILAIGWSVRLSSAWLPWCTAAG